MVAVFPTHTHTHTLRDILVSFAGVTRTYYRSLRVFFFYDIFYIVVITIVLNARAYPIQSVSHARPRLLSHAGSRSIHRRRTRVYPFCGFFRFLFISVTLFAVNGPLPYPARRPLQSPRRSCIFVRRLAKQSRVCSVIVRRFSSVSRPKYFHSGTLVSSLALVVLSNSFHYFSPDHVRVCIYARGTKLISYLSSNLA